VQRKPLPTTNQNSKQKSRQQAANQTNQAKQRKVTKPRLTQKGAERQTAKAAPKVLG